MCIRVRSQFDLLDRPRITPLRPFGALISPARRAVWPIVPDPRKQLRPTTKATNCLDGSSGRRSIQ